MKFKNKVNLKFLTVYFSIFKKISAIHKQVFNIFTLYKYINRNKNMKLAKGEDNVK